MNTRTLSILIVTFCVTAALAIGLFSRGAQAVELPPGDYMSDTEVEPAVASGDQTQPIAAEGTYRKSEHGPVGAATSQGQSENTAGWTSGVIRGDVQLAVSVLDRLGSITVVVEEMRNPFAKKPQKTGHSKTGGNKDDENKPATATPHRLYAKVQRGEGTPTFEVRDVPFSDYPYRVTLHAAKLNGSQAIVAVNAEDPLHDIRLAITPGVPFSVLLRDQDAGSYPDIDVLLRPTGLPHGRQRLAGKTDNFGSVVFDDVLAGQYELISTLDGKPFGDPEVVTVPAIARTFGRKIQGQGHVVTIERGVQVDVRVSDRMGYAIKDCTVTATATDRRKLIELEGKTDGQGTLRFSRLLPGTWHLVVQKQGWQRVDQQLRLRQDQQPMLREIKLTRPLRRGR